MIWITKQYCIFVESPTSLPKLKKLLLNEKGLQKMVQKKNKGNYLETEAKLDKSCHWGKTKNKRKAPISVCHS